jgi:LysM repeat protein
MKLVKIFGVVMGVHAAVFLCIFAVPGCRSTGKKPVAGAPVTGAAADSPVAATEGNTPVAATTEAPAADVAAVRFSPTRPGSPVALEATAPAATAPATYSVAKGDNLWSIAKKNGVTVKQLTAANNLRTDSRLSLGQKLVIPGKAAAPATSPAGAEVKPAVPAAAPASAATAATVHVVKSGESLGGIAKKYQVKVGDIATANNIADPTKLRVGQSLKIPGGHSTATKSASATVKPAVTTAKPAPKAVAPAPVPAQTPVPVTAPAAPVFTSPVLETAPAAAPAVGESPLITPATPTTDAPVIRVEEAGAAKAQ